MSRPLELDVAGRTVEISHPDRVVYPDAGLTKADVARYWARIADTALPYLRGYPVAQKRFPRGTQEKGFFQKDTEHHPDWVTTVGLARSDGEELEHVVIEDAATLVWLSQQSAFELHQWLSPAGDPRRPDQLVIDLDPPEGEVAAARWAARRVHDLLDELGCPSLVKTSGSKGFHIHVRLDGRADFDQVRRTAHRLAGVLAKRHPERLTDEHRKAKRRGRVYVDVGRNAYGQTAVIPYSLRAKPGAPIATPIGWDELGRTDPQDHTVRSIFRRLGQKDDPWAGAWDRATSADAIDARLDDLGS